MSVSDPFAAHPPRAEGRWGRVNATPDEAAVLGDDESVAHLSDSDLADQLAAFREAGGVGAITDDGDVDGSAPDSTHTPLSVPDGTDGSTPPDGGADGDTAPDAAQASQVTPDSE